MRESPRRFRPYPRYKDSGAEWPGKIPAHWETVRVADHTHLINGFPFDSERFSLDEGIPLVRIRDLNSEETELRYAGPVVDAALIKNGDILIGMDGDFNVGRWKGGAALLNQRMCCLRPSASIDGQFLFYSIPLPLKIINDLTYSTTVKHLSSLDVKKTRLPHPPHSEQRGVAAFLDREARKIDALLAKKEQLIELLQEKRTVLITQAVTKGLEPNVPMKDSGVEWLGEIPAHWEIRRLKYLVPGITVGIVVTPAKYYVDEGVPCLRSLNVSSAQIKTDDLVFISAGANELHRKSKIFEGDLVVVRTGLAGTAAIVTPELDGCNCIDLLIIRKSRALLPKLLYYYINSKAAAGQVEAHSVGAIQAHYNTSTLSDLIVPSISLPEQRQIIEHLDRQTAAIDLLAKRVQDAIDRLKEFRTALISAAVTGKIDVRGEVAS